MLIYFPQRCLLLFTCTALDEAMNASDAETLQKLYVLLDSDGAYKEFRKALSHHVRERATKLISDPANDTKMVATLLDFKRFCESTVDALLTSEPSTLRNDDQLAGPSNRETKRRNALQSEIRDGIKAGVETRQATPAELIGQWLRIGCLDVLVADTCNRNPQRNISTRPCGRVKGPCPQRHSKRCSTISLTWSSLPRTRMYSRSFISLNWPNVYCWLEVLVPRRRSIWSRNCRAVSAAMALLVDGFDGEVVP